MFTQESITKAINTLNSTKLVKYIAVSNTSLDQENFREVYKSLPIEVRNKALKKIRYYARSHIKKYTSNPFDPKILEALK